MGFLNRILFIIIAVSIPVVSMISAVNIAYRMPDIYSYEFNKNQIADEIGLGMKDDEIASFFSDFMSGKKDDFELFAEYRDREQSVFSTVEQTNMENARSLLNHTLYILAAAAALVLLGCCMHLAKKKKYELRAAFKGGILVYAAMMAVLFIAYHIQQVRTALYDMIFIQPFGADDILPQMLTAKFAQFSLSAIGAISLVIMIIITSAVWKLTKPRRMFWQ